VVALALVLGAGLLLWPKSSPAAGELPAAPLQPNPVGARTSEGGGVTIKVTWQGPDAGPVFAVVMDTHSIDLDGYNLRELATLRTDEGAEVHPSGWDAPKGGHHRSGSLTFPATTADGAPLIGPSTKSLELTVRGVAGVNERKLKWELPS
jgi:hypothetical protein